jgi:uncharacterized protein YbjT (DUF2867 family)
MNLVVLGGTGGLGRAVVLAAHRSGHTITVMARDAAGFAPPIVGVRMVLGDVTDAHDIERAVAGQDAVVWTVRAAPVKHGADAFESGIRHVVAAMRTHGVPRLVCVSCSEGERTTRERFLPMRLPRARGRSRSPEHQDLREAPVRDSGLAWTIVRTATLAYGPATGLYQTLDGPAPRMQRIPRADVAAFIVENLADPEFVHRTVLLAG